MVANLLFVALLGAVLVASFLWPEFRRLQRLRRENEELQREHDRLVGENREKADGVLERWTPRGEGS